MAQFHYYPLKLIRPEFDSKLVDLILSLEELRTKHMEQTTPLPLFHEIKLLFHILESIGSARIEGNNTTILDYIDTQQGESVRHSGDSIKEILNIENALQFIETTIHDYPLNKGYLLELHKQIVDGLPTGNGGGGDRTPGQFRAGQVYISNSEHCPPDALTVEGYIDELLDFVKTEDSPKYDLIKIALAHHRFVWIHPFSNGNGRTVRLFTYALLLKYGFRVSIANRLINPTAIFCNNRDRYYEYLTKADRGDSAGLEEWCEYVLGGLRIELEKVYKLTEYSYLTEKILIPMLEEAFARTAITEEERTILRKVIETKVLQNSDLKSLFPKATDSSRSKKIRGLLDRQLLDYLPGHKRKYSLRLTRNPLTRYAIGALRREGYFESLD